MKNGYTFCIISRMKRLRRGFSLLEVMIVVVIIGILVTLDHPNLEGYLQRLKQTEAKAGHSSV